MDYNQFLLHRRDRWNQLASLLEQVEKRGVSSLSPRDADRLFALYRLVSSDLNLVQTRSGNPALLEYLENLVSRAYATVAAPRRTNIFAAWWRIIRHYFPATMRREWRLLLLATLAMLAGAGFGAFVSATSPEYAEVLVPAQFGHLLEDPAEYVAQLEEAERTGGSASAAGAGQHSIFATYLIQNNIRVTILAFALGLTFGVFTIIMLFYNAVALGHAAVSFIKAGEAMFLLGWLGPHGSIELPCIIFGGTAGLMLARCQFRRNRGSTLSQIREIRPALIDIIIGTATLLVIAGVIEATFSQINEPTIPYAFKITVAIALFAGLCAYLFWIPVNPRPDEETSALAVDISEQ